MYYTYIIYSASYDIYYKGVSQSPEKRLSEHNNDESRYTAGKGPWLLVYKMIFETKKQALIEEKESKAWTGDPWNFLSKCMQSND